MATRPSARSRSRAGGPEDGAVDPALPQKKRARHRLIGAIALCLLALVVVPQLLDSEPTTPGSDIAIVIPSRDTPLPPPRAPSADADAPRPAERASDERTEPKAEARPAPPPAPPAAAPATEPARPAAKGETRPAEPRAADAKPAEPRRDAAKGDEIQRLLEQQQRPRAEAGAARYLLQVGAYGSEAGAAGAIDKVKGAGLPAFTEPIRTDKGERVRVRVGPFPSREAAEQARARLKAAGIEAALIAP
ncbi:MAG TPA: SPOR domain-containing protein [Burkholderiaceae bacterium]|nr:SPOR domain-containing protein [Burkholderiaceae bacterium]